MRVDRIFTSTSEIAAGVGSTSVNDGLFSVGCTNANNCVAVGSEGSGSAQKAIYVNDTAGTWATDGASLTLPSDANSNAYPRLNGVSCPQSGDCAAVGTYQSSSGSRGMAVSQSSGTWPAAVSVTPPSNAYSTPLMTLSAVTCTGAGNCDAVGNYATAAGNLSAGLLVATQSGGGSWTSTQLAYPTGSIVDPANSTNTPLAVSCSSVGNCVSVGEYQDGSTVTQGLIETQSGGGSWVPSEALLPTNAVAGGAAILYGVSCPSNGNCVAVGEYHTSSTTVQAMVIDEVGGTWSRGTELTTPTSASLRAISCTGVGACLAVGYLSDNANHDQAAYAEESGGAWGSIVPLSSPANVNTNPAAMFVSTGCASDAGCTAVGAYQDNVSHIDPLGASGTLSTTSSTSTTTTITSTTTTTTPKSTTTTTIAKIAPRARITKLTLNKKAASAVLTFSATVKPSTFTCSLVRALSNKRFPAAKYSGCSSPKKYQHLRAGRYEFLVRARGHGGAQTTATTRSFTFP